MNHAFYKKELWHVVCTTLSKGNIAKEEYSVTIEALAEKYMRLCQKHGCSNEKSIVPVEYKLNTDQGGIIAGATKMEVTTYTGETIMIEHIDEFSYMHNLQTLKRL